MDPILLNSTVRNTLSQKSYGATFFQKDEGGAFQDFLKRVEVSKNNPYDYGSSVHVEYGVPQSQSFSPFHDSFSTQNFSTPASFQISSSEMDSSPVMDNQEYTFEETQTEVDEQRKITEENQPQNSSVADDEKSSSQDQEEPTAQSETADKKDENTDQPETADKKSELTNQSETVDKKNEIQLLNKKEIPQKEAQGLKVDKKIVEKAEGIQNLEKSDSSPTKLEVLREKSSGNSSEKVVLTEGKDVSNVAMVSGDEKLLSKKIDGKELSSQTQIEGERLDVAIKVKEVDSSRGGRDVGSQNQQFAEKSPFVSEVVKLDSLKPDATAGQIQEKFSQFLKQNGMENIVKQAKILLKDHQSGEIRLILKPEKLGLIKINLNINENSVVGKIFVENSSIRDAFKENLAELNRALVDSGFEGAQVDLSFSQNPFEFNEKESQIADSQSQNSSKDGIVKTDEGTIQYYDFNKDLTLNLVL